MQSFIKNNKIIINNMIFKDELENLISFIENNEDKNFKLVKLYDILGNVSGISFEPLE